MRCSSAYLGGALLTRYLLPMYPLVLLSPSPRFIAALLTGMGLRSHQPRHFVQACLSILRMDSLQKITWPTRA